MKTTISFSQGQYRAATSWRGWDLEDTSYALGFSSRSSTDQNILVREVFVPAEGDVKRSRYYVQPSPLFLCRLYDRAVALGATEIIQLHDHPFCHSPRFSGIDDAAGIRMAADLVRIGIKARVSQIVLGRDNERYQARVVRGVGSNDSFHPVNNLEIVGSQSWSSYEKGNIDHEIETAHLPSSAFETRNIQAFGRKAIRSLHQIRILILGGGGLGSAMAYMLSHLGVWNIGTMDYDRIDASNINRQYFVVKPSSAIGRMKASFLTGALRMFNRRGRYHAVNGNIFDQSHGPMAVKNADLVICTLDSQSARDEAAVLCARYGKPLLNVANSIYLDKSGKLEAAFAVSQWFIPRDPDYPCLRCQGVINPDTVNSELMSDRLKAMKQKAGYVVGTPISPAPQVIPINGVAAGYAAWELVMWLSGVRKPTPFIHYDVMSHRMNLLRPLRDPACTVCGDDPSSCLVTGDSDFDLISDAQEQSDDALPPKIDSAAALSPEVQLQRESKE